MKFDQEEEGTDFSFHFIKKVRCVCAEVLRCLFGRPLGCGGHRMQKKASVSS